MWRWWCFSAILLYFSGPIAKTITFGSIFCVIIGRSQIFIDTQGAEFCNHFWQWYLCYIDVGIWACWLLAGTVTPRNHLIQTVSSNYAEYEAFQEEIASGLPCSTWLLEVRGLTSTAPRTCKADRERGNAMIWDTSGKHQTARKACAHWIKIPSVPSPRQDTVRSPKVCQVPSSLHTKWRLGWDMLRSTCPSRNKLNMTWPNKNPYTFSTINCFSGNLGCLLCLTINRLEEHPSKSWETKPFRNGKPGWAIYLEQSWHEKKH